MTDTYRVTAEELRAFIERLERLDAEKRDISDQAKDVMAECKGRGYDTKAVRKVIALRKKTRDQIAEEEAVEAMYREALGL
ncbi:MAG: putative double-stranded DNA-binding protein [Prokaryotic dsDNA virus sp.]|nr:MAG: putative double-stranded DNA-binding protein [Prokaryotic dsDNA virus sp.]QDP53157.1 MAG: putative double-stranded DNA-binding protein [Prokaryotic dsDNA virus sp.]|tara:strand:- start:23105 stop:23347 length:243 start_codon:yes stop_codon:yes gene_type:complete